MLDKIVRNSFHDNLNVVAVLMHRRACTGACAFFAVSVACIKIGVFES